MGPGVQCTIQGTVRGNRLEFTYQEPAAHGEGWFELSADGSSFSGQWHPDGIPQWGAWTGSRVGFGGLWDSTFGLMRLLDEGGLVHGFYEMAGAATVEGRLSGDRLTFTYREPRVGGEGWFKLSPDGLFFDGQWRQEGGGPWQPWQGRKLLPQAGLTWLVVLETPWQRLPDGQGIRLRPHAPRVLFAGAAGAGTAPLLQQRGGAQAAAAAS